MKASTLTDFVPDLNDGEPWSDNDIEDLRAALLSGRSVEEVAQSLCRADLEDVRRKAKEIGLWWHCDVTPPAP